MPQNGIYSQSADLPWMAASWAYDLKLAIGYKLLGLRALPAMLMLFKVALAVMTFSLAGGLRGRFRSAVVLSAIAQYILGAMPATPAYCSVLLFAGELLLLFASPRSCNRRLLFWLPPLFFAWANLDHQFVYGVALLLLFVLATLIEERGLTSRVRSAGTILGLSLIATILTPYLYHPYGTFFGSVTSAANSYFPDYKAMTFHQPQDYLLLLLTMAAFLSLGLRRSRDFFQISLLIGCAALSFHSQRDIWLITLAAIAVVAESIKSGDVVRKESPRTSLRLLTAALTAVLLLAVFEVRVPHSDDALLAKAAESYPVAACNYIRQHNLPQPWFNAFEWGGFLMWYQPEYPVAIDGRTSLYPDDLYITYSKVMNADEPYTAYPAITEARTILLPRHSLLAEALGSVPAFQVVYRDDVSTVLIPAVAER